MSRYIVLSYEMACRTAWSKPGTIQGFSLNVLTLEQGSFMGFTRAGGKTALQKSAASTPRVAKLASTAGMTNQAMSGYNMPLKRPNNSFKPKPLRGSA
ncbi:hypothetical protein [Xanthomonas pisi]|uniref:hypothetical protein n=1 Tax=Xanthomonas pisi TaxID=56457 RepID=UPI001CA47A0B|nr:hypothetical protein [Xanthomonas pisi]